MSRKRSVDPNTGHHRNRVRRVSDSDTSSTGSYRSGTPDWIRSGSESSSQSSAGLSRAFDSDSDTNQSYNTNASTSSTLVDFSLSDISFPSSHGSPDSHISVRTEGEMTLTDSTAGQTSSGSSSSSSSDSSGSSTSSGGSSPAPVLDYIDNDDIQFIRNQSPNNYKFKRLIGRGSFGNVYLGTRLPQNIDCAIKVLRRGQQLGTYSVEQEVNITRHIMSSPHTYVLQFYNVFVNTELERAYICSEYSSIGDLYANMKRNNSSGISIWQPLEEPQVRYLIRCIAQGVNHLHSVDIAHGDIKPENILLFGKPNTGHTETTDFCQLIPNLTDFSNSRQRLDTDPNELWATERLCTLEYAAPESDGFHDMFRADVYSVGCLFLTILLGARPFEPPITTPTGDGPEDMQQNADYETLCTNRKNSKEYLAEICQNFSPILKELLFAVLEPNPETRMSLNQFLEHQWFDTN